MPKDTRINIRLTAELREKVEKACKLTGLDEPTVVRACLEAFADHVEKEGGIWLPLAVVPKASPKAPGVPPHPSAPSARSAPPPSGSTHSLSEEPQNPGTPKLTRTRKVMRAQAFKNAPKK